MSRRDTIIVAVLVNTGLLAALFMMAIRTESPINDPFQQGAIAENVVTPASNFPEEEIQPVFEEKNLNYATSRDEIDEVLKTYAKTNQQQVYQASDTRDLKRQDLKTVPEKRESLMPPEGGFVEVRVKKGDFLEKIARANGVSVNQIMEVNNMATSRIDVGQVLKIPIEKKSITDSQTNVPKSTRESLTSEPEYYTIKSGDNPWKIARQYHVKFEDLLKLNDLDESKARNLKPGDVLRVK